VRYGHFDDERREYVITRPDTPWPGSTYLGSEAYFGISRTRRPLFLLIATARLRRLPATLHTTPRRSGRPHIIYFATTSRA